MDTALEAPRKQTKSIGIVGRVLIALIDLYRWFLSPLIGQQCRFHPTCSHYARDAVFAHGALRGTYLAAKRLLRCNPWCEGGIDHVPPQS
jgi:putative membrane protein insertion efficiency factor